MIYLIQRNNLKNKSCNLKSNSALFDHLYSELMYKNNFLVTIILGIILFLYQILLVIINNKLITFIKLKLENKEKEDDNDPNNLKIIKLNSIIIYGYILLIFCTMVIILRFIFFKKAKISSKINFLLIFQFELQAIYLRQIMFNYFGSSQGLETQINLIIYIFYFTMIDSNHVYIIINSIISIAITWVIAWINPSIKLNTNILTCTSSSMVHIAIGIFSFFINKKLQLQFIYNFKNEKKKDSLILHLDNFQDGLIISTKTEIKFFNEYVIKNFAFLLEKKVKPNKQENLSLNTEFPIKETLQISSNLATHECKNKYKNNFKNYLIQENFFNNLENINNELEEDLFEKFNDKKFTNSQIFDEMIKFYKLKKVFNNFTLIGTKNCEEVDSLIFKKVLKIKIFLKIVETDKKEYHFEIMLNKLVSNSNANRSGNGKADFNDNATGDLNIYPSSNGIAHDIENNNSNENIKEQKEIIKNKSLYFAKASHEFKNPLIMIKELMDEIIENFAGLSNLNTKETILKNLSICKNLSSYLLILVKDMELFSKKENSFKLVAEKSNFNIRDLMNFLEQLVLCLILKKYSNLELSPLKFKIEINENVPNYITTDSTRLTQVLINLLSNSIKFSMNGTIHLLVKKEENKIIFSVSDEGVGILEKDKDKLFKEFTNKSTINNNYGSGLGLSIVKQLCTLLGGDINFSHNHPKGSIFSFDIDFITNVENSVESKVNVNSKKQRSSKISQETIKHFFDLNQKNFLNVYSNDKTNLENYITDICLKNESLPTNDLIGQELDFSENSDEVVKEFINNKNILGKSSSNNSLSIDSEKKDKYDSKLFNKLASNQIRYSPCRNSNSFNYSNPIFINIVKEQTDSFFNSKFVGSTFNESEKKPLKNIIHRHSLPNIQYHNFVHDNLVIKKKFTSYTKCDTLNSNYNIKKSKLNIIIADDEAFVRKSTIRKLDEFLKYSNVDLQLDIIETQDGVECLYAAYCSIFQQIKIDFIITDNEMKFMSGILLSELIFNLFNSSIPVFILSACDLKLDLSHPSGIFSKPLNSEMIKKIFENSELILKG